MAYRLEGTAQLNEILFQSMIDSFPHRDNYEKVAAAVAAHAVSIEALENGGSPPASSSAEVIAARDDATDLQTRIRSGQRVGHDGIIAGVLNECAVTAWSPENDKVYVDYGEGIVNGALFHSDDLQELDPADFSVGETNPRIDVVYIGADGTAGITTGLPAASPKPEQIPDNTIEIARVFLYPSGANPNVPKTIYDYEGSSGNSFIIPKADRFLFSSVETRPEMVRVNQVRNGSFEMLDDTGGVYAWTANNATIAQDADALFGDKSLKITNDGTNSIHYAQTSILNPLVMRGRWVTVTAWIKLAGTYASANETYVSLIQTGASPAVDTFTIVNTNTKTWTRAMLKAYVDNDVTSLTLRIFPHWRDAYADSTAVYVDGVQLHVGKSVVGFEFPVLVKYEADGSCNLYNLQVFNDLEVKGDLDVGGDSIFGGDVHVNGILYTSGATDVIAWLGL